MSTTREERVKDLILSLSDDDVGLPTVRTDHGTLCTEIERGGVSVFFKEGRDKNCVVVDVRSSPPRVYTSLRSFSKRFGKETSKK
jgi:hypothetical protein